MGQLTRLRLSTLTHASNFYLGYPGSQKRSLENKNKVRLLIQQTRENGLRYARGPVHFPNHPLHNITHLFSNHNSTNTMAIQTTNIQIKGHLSVRYSNGQLFRCLVSIKGTKHWICELFKWGLNNVAVKNHDMF